MTSEANNVKKWDELDFLFNRAKLKNVNPKIAKHERQKILLEIDSILKKKKLEYYLDFPTNYIFEDIEEQIFEDKIKVLYFDSSLINDVFKNTDFQIVDSDNNSIWLLRNSRIYKITCIKSIKEDDKFLDAYFEGNIFKIIKSKKIKKYHKFQGFNLLKIFINNKLNKKISKKKFLKLEIESKSSKSWILRKKHLDVVTNFGKNRKVYEIINFFTNEKNFDNIQAEIVETPTSRTFEEPLYANKNFWNSGNNYFIYPLIYQFKKNVVSYKDANNYIRDIKEPMIYSNEYYKSLEDMSDKEIVEFMKNNPIEISNNSIVSGKHRSFAMIGRLIEGKKYIPFYAKYI